ncbi:glycosyltransferase family 2 protein [Leptolyngbya sp. FACHB-541]|uniref:glycosyltransferase family 2 protein n=1 Tax=Leptolyngbya sp. FACHB-541 TaxID=2692810 RepID=UPI001686AD8B|nr:glycosyltransferase family 2 protein [Leptolyngbya sp. FACHB-541]MBD2001062.1 glycosyltransferase family 2 protein [Leptolyngbya sp. FACHB-541]
MNTCEVTAVIPTYNRSKQLLKAINKILECDPQPEEIIVHVDANDTATQVVLHSSKFQSVKVIQSATQVGPGGGRNKSIARARNPIVASFDDDSYPIDPDYFARLLQLFEIFPKAAVIGSAIFHQNETVTPDEYTATWVADFVGCGCAYRRDVFLQTKGYVQLPVAYGMEETDLSLRLHHLGWGVLQSPWLRVFHDTKLEHHSNPKITAASIANQALLAYLRYPATLWWLGGMQCLSRISWLMRHQRWNGIMTGLFSIPGLIRQQHHHRQTVSSQSLLSYLRLRRGGTSDIPTLEVL